MEQKQHNSMPRFGQSQTTVPVTIDSLAAGWEKRSWQEALDELGRELGVRERLYAKWVIDSKHTETEARDRLQRMIMAAWVIETILGDEGICKQLSCQLAQKDEDKAPF